MLLCKFLLYATYTVNCSLIILMNKQACDCDLGAHEVSLEHFLQTKANIGR